MPDQPFTARVAVWRSAEEEPDCRDIMHADLAAFVEESVGVLADASGVPPSSSIRTSLREVLENIIHTTSRHLSLVVLLGERLRFVVSDAGPGIPDKERAALPGYSTASDTARGYIRGVGLGLYRARELAELGGGQLALYDNLDGGTTVELTLAAAEPPARPERGSEERGVAVSRRQNDVLFLLTEMGEAGPRLIANELKIGLSTAHRELVLLENKGFVVVSESGKRSLSARGRAYLQNLLSL
ncbi:MAG: ATP-binding protein [Candidatus Geothermincolia bacterium]